MFNVEFLSNVLAEKSKIIKFVPNSVLSDIDNYTKGSLGDVCSKISGKLISEMNFYHSTIKPIFTALLEEYKNIPNQYDKSSDICKIVVNKVNEFIANAVKNDDLLNHYDYRFKDVPKIFLGSPENIEDIYNITKYDDYNSNKILKEQLDSISKDELLGFWDTFIVSPLDTINKLKNDNSYLIKYENSVIAGILYTVLKSILNDKPNWVTYDDTGVLKDYLHNVSILLSKYNLLANDENETKSRVISSISDNTVYVNKIPYDEFLNKGGTPDIVLALIALGDDPDNLYTPFGDGLLANKDKLLKIKSDYDKLNLVKKQLNSANSIRTGYSLSYIKVMNEQITPEIINMLGLDLQELSSEVHKYLNKLSFIDLFDVNEIALHIIGDIVFKNTNFGKIVKLMEKYHNDLDGKSADLVPDSKLCATLAVIDYCIDYILAQVEITDKI